MTLLPDSAWHVSLKLSNFCTTRASSIEILSQKISYWTQMALLNWSVRHFLLSLVDKLISTIFLTFFFVEFVSALFPIFLVVKLVSVVFMIFLRNCPLSVNVMLEVNFCLLS